MTQERERLDETTRLLLTSPEDELPGLAERLGQALLEMGAYHCRESQSPTFNALAERARAIPPGKVSWSELSALSERDASAGMEKWGEITNAAQQELRSGQRAWQAIAPPYSTPIDRARFLTLRGEFLRDWRPSGAIERTLIDQIAQALTMQFYWTEKLTERSHAQAASDLRDREQLGKQERHYRAGEWLPERVTEKEMIAEAQTNIERWSRMYVRLLRTLRDLRRYNVTIQNAGQVNIADKQVNVGEKQRNTASSAKTPAKKRRARTLRMAS